MLKVTLTEKLTMLNYTPEMYSELEKYASDLEITCDYYLHEFADNKQLVRFRRDSLLNDF